MKQTSRLALRAAFLSVFIWAIAALPARAASYTWTNTAGGNWNVAANWSPNAVPGGSDTASITTTGNYTVTNNTTQSVGTLTLGASTADGTTQTLLLSSSTFTVNNASSGTAQGSLSITAGTLAGAGALTMAGPLNWTGGSISGVVSCNGGSINEVNGFSAGTVINTGTLSLTPYIYDGNGSVISNAASGTINILLNGQSVTYLNYGGTATFYNAGQINVSGTGLSGGVGDKFINTGTVTVNSGALSLNGGGTNTGTMTAAAGATLQIGGSYSLSGGSVSGAGNFKVSGGPVAIASPFNFAGTNTFSSGTADFTGSSYIITNTVLISGGTVNFDGSGVVTPLGLSLSSGTLGGASPVLVNGSFNWTGGSVTNTVTFNGGTINEVNGLAGGTLINTGTLALTPYIYDGAGSVISNAASGIINVTLNGQSITYQNYGAPSAFYNAGQINISGAGLSGGIGDKFINTGTVTVNGGTLELGNGGTNTGSMVLADGATLQVAGNYNFAPGSALSGAGTVKFSSGINSFTGAYTLTNAVLISGGTVNFNGNGSVNLTSLTLTSGTLGGSNTIQVSGAFNWTGGSVTGAVMFNGGTIDEVNGLDGGTLINTGTLLLTPYIYDGAGSVISNAAGGVIDITLNGQAITYLNYGALSTFYNAGQLNISGTGLTGNIGDSFINTGTVTVTSGTLSFSGGGTNTGTMTAAAGATLQVGGNYSFTGGSLSGAGNFKVSGGTVGIGIPFNFGGTNIFAGGTANFTGSSYIVTNAVVMSGGSANFNGSGIMSLAGLAISSGTLGGSNPVVVNGAFNWTGGSVTGIVSFNGGTINEVNGLDGGTLINTGILLLTPYIYDGAGSVISNAAGGIINVTLNGQSITYQNYGAPSTFYNAGQINISGTGISGNVGDNFINTGTVTVNSGTLILANGGTNTGPLVLAAGATLQVGANYSFAGGSAVSGAGTLKFAGGTSSFTGTYSLANAVLISGGTVNFNGNGTVNLAGLNLSSGILGGSNLIQVSSGFNWTGGSITGAVSVNGGTINEVNGLDGGTLINTGILSLAPYIYDGGGSVISNAASGTINVTLNNNPITFQNYGAPSTFYNAGQINVSGAGFSGGMGDNFINTGAVAINSGTLSLSGGGTNTGTMIAAGGATLQVGGSYAFNGGSIQGAGLLKFLAGTGSFSGTYSVTNTSLISGGTANFNGNGNVNLGGLTLTSGILEGTNPVQVSSGFNWTGGTITGIVICNGGTVNEVNGLNGGTLINTGILSLTPYLYDGGGSVISNAASGTINVTLNNNPITFQNYGAPSTFYNAGQINVSGAGLTGTIGDNFTNTGVININSGTLSLAGNYSLAGGTINSGLNSAANFGKLSLTGSPAPLAGAIGLLLSSNYVPLINVAFPVVTFASSTNAFSRTNLPPVAVWQTAYNPANVTFTLLKYIPQLTWTNPAAVVYGTALGSAQLDATAASPTNLGAALAGNFTYTPLSGTVLNSGSNQTLLVSFAPTDSTDYTNASTNVIINVLRAPLSITATNRVKTYGQTETFTGTEFAASGLVNGDTVSSATLSSTGDAPTNSVNGSPYTITITNAVGDAGLTNYIITYDTGLLTVNPAPLTITAGAQNKTYGQTVAFGPGSILFTPSGLQNGETVGTVTLAVSGNGGAPTASVASSPYTITPSAATGGTFTPSNYQITYAPANLSVSAAPLSITADAQSKNYGQTVTFGSGSTLFTSSGLQNGETVGTVTLAVTGNGGAGTASVASSPYAITPSAATGGTFTPGNYAIAYHTGNLSVSAAPLSITADAQSKIYGQTLTFGSGSTLFTPSGLQNGETVGTVTLVVTGNGGAPTASVAGSPYSITPSAATGGTFTPGNYQITYDTGNLNVSAAPLSITADAQSKNYGQTVAFGSGSTLFTSSGLQNGETVGTVTLAVTGNGGAPTASVAGSPYAITPSAATGGTFTPGNYAIAYHPGNLTVNAVPLGIMANNRTKTYGQLVTFAGTEFAASGLLNADTVTSVTLASAGAAANASVAGSPYSIIPSAAVGSGLSNYSITYTNGLLTVTLPTLYFVSSPPNMILSWTTNASAFTLNTTTNLAPPIAWQPITSGITVNGTNNTITIPDVSGNQFYELIAP